MDRPLPVLKQTAMELDLIEMIHCDNPDVFFRGGYANVHEATLVNGTKVAIKTECTKCWHPCRTFLSKRVGHLSLEEPLW